MVEAMLGVVKQLHAEPDPDSKTEGILLYHGRKGHADKTLVGGVYQTHYPDTVRTILGEKEVQRVRYRAWLPREVRDPDSPIEAEGEVAIGEYSHPYIAVIGLVGAYVLDTNLYNGGDYGL